MKYLKITQNRSKGCARISLNVPYVVANMDEAIHFGARLCHLRTRRKSNRNVNFSINNSTIVHRLPFIREEEVSAGVCPVSFDKVCLYLFKACCYFYLRFQHR